jgi:hypothetical protein
MLTRLAVLTTAVFLMSQTAHAQDDGTGTAVTSGNTTSSGGNSTDGTNVSPDQFAPNTGAVNSGIISNTVETGRTSGLSNLGGSTLTNAANGANQLPGGSQFGGARNNTNRSVQRGTARSSRTSIRPSLRLGFSPVIRPSADVSRSVSQSFSQIAGRVSRIGEVNPALRSVRIVPGKAGQLTLTGTVPTAAAKRLAANILRMEPGVRSVTNNLTVAQVQPPLNTSGAAE